MSKLIDTPQYHDAAEKATQLASEGIAAVVGYYFRYSAYKQRVNYADAVILKAAGVATVTILEDGSPITPGYFTAARGVEDAQLAIYYAQAAHQPTGTLIYAAYDCDLSDADIQSNVFDYAKSFHDTLKAAGYLAGAYGCGALLVFLKEQGYASKAWLSQSQGFNGYKAGLAIADIVQGPEGHVLGLDIDSDVSVHDAAGAWVPEG